MRGERTLQILEALSEAANDTLDFFEVFLTAGYGVSLGKFQSELLKRKLTRKTTVADFRRHQRQTRQRYFNLLYKLKRDGLIKEQKRSAKILFTLTLKGKHRLKTLRSEQLNALPSRKYEPEVNNVFTIVAFDVPESQRRKRVWLRSVLRNLGFRMLQKSLWLGKVKIPKKFIDDLYRLGLVDYIEIFEIKKAGSLSHIV
jgi:DNA-binding transcriptional regulator PaaX